MAELKTQQNSASVAGYLRALEDRGKRRDCEALKKMMGRITGKRAKMWGANIVGFGNYQYTYASGWSGEYFVTGFSPRKQNLTVYVMPGFGQYRGQLEKIGSHKLGKSCLYLKSLDNVDMAALEFIVADSVSRMKQMYQCDL